MEDGGTGLQRRRGAHGLYGMGVRGGEDERKDFVLMGCTLKKVVVGGSVSSLPGSVIIKWFEKRIPWRRTRDTAVDIPSHAWAAGYSEEFGAVLVLEASWFGYRPSEWSNWVNHKRITKAYSNSKTDFGKAVKWAGKQLGNPYDYRSLFVFFIKYLIYYFSLQWVRHPFETPKNLQCSEAKARFLQQEGYMVDLPPEEATPVNLLFRIEEISDFDDVTDKVRSGEWWQEFFAENAEDA